MDAGKVSEALSKPLRNAYAMQELEKFNSGGSTSIYVNKLLEAGAFVAVAGTALGLGEAFWVNRTKSA